MEIFVCNEYIGKYFLEKKTDLTGRMLIVETEYDIELVVLIN